MQAFKLEKWFLQHVWFDEHLNKWEFETVDLLVDLLVCAVDTSSCKRDSTCIYKKI